MPPRISAEYRAWLRSPAWRAIRQECLEAAGNSCAACERSAPGGRALHVHHRYGVKNDPDHEHLVVLCAPCHDLVERLARRGRFLTSLTAQRLIALARDKQRRR